MLVTRPMVGATTASMLTGNAPNPESLRYFIESSVSHRASWPDCRRASPERVNELALPAAAARGGTVQTTATTGPTCRARGTRTSAGTRSSHRSPLPPAIALDLAGRDFLAGARVRDAVDGGQE